MKCAECAHVASIVNAMVIFCFYVTFVSPACARKSSSLPRRNVQINAENTQGTFLCQQSATEHWHAPTSKPFLVFSLCSLDIICVVICLSAMAHQVSHVQVAEAWSSIEGGISVQ